MRSGTATAAVFSWSGHGANKHSEGDGRPSEEGNYGEDMLQLAAGSVVKVQNFPASWVEDKALPMLSAKLAKLLQRFGLLHYKPVAKAERSGELVFFAAFNEALAAKEAVAKLHGTDLRNNAEKKAAGGAAAPAWQRFSVQLEEEVLSDQVMTLWRQQNGERQEPKLKEPEAEEFEFAEDDTVDADCADGSETEPPSEGEDLQSDDEGQSKVTVLLRNFPSSWLAAEVLPQLGARISALLTKFGRLASKPKVLDGAMSSLGIVATAAFQAQEDAFKAIQALDGLDWRSPAEVDAGGRPAAVQDRKSVV